MRVGEWVGIFVQQDANDAAFGELAPGLFGGPEMQRLLAIARRAATSNVPVLIVGETGSGKERVARAVHEFSGRKGAFLPINCGALPEHLAEAELFGYRRGAFTGADKDHPGYFRLADGGTLFLDEMPELLPAFQVKLLRIIEDGSVCGLGERAAQRVNVRIISATQVALPTLVSQGKLRRDLAARLSGLELRIPPLSQRRADIAALFTHFLTRGSGGNPPKVDSRLIEALCLDDWPENVRGLELITRTLLAMHGDERVLRRRHLREHRTVLPVASHPPPPAPPELPDLERLQLILHENGGNVRATAAALGISRQRVYRLLEDKRTSKQGRLLQLGSDEVGDS